MFVQFRGFAIGFSYIYIATEHRESYGNGVVMYCNDTPPHSEGGTYEWACVCVEGVHVCVCVWVFNSLKYYPQKVFLQL